MTSLLRFGAISGVLCGLFIGVPGAIEAVTGETAATSVILGVSPAFAVPLLVALQLGQLPAAGRLGVVGYAVNLIGLGLFGGAAFTLNLALFFLDDAVVDDLATPTRLALLGSALVFAVGSAMFGASMLRARRYPRLPAWAYTTVLPVFALAGPLPDSVLTSGLHVVAGGTLVWLSVAVRANAQALAPVAAGPAGLR
ncbi:MAG TPA: hypothetical protein VIL37_20955 [Natronosporangium sp.]